jgi:hypothetical protein
LETCLALDCLYIIMLWLIHIILCKVVRNDIMCPFCIYHYVNIHLNALISFIKLNVDIFLIMKFFWSNRFQQSNFFVVHFFNCHTPKDFIVAHKFLVIQFMIVWFPPLTQQLKIFNRHSKIYEHCSKMFQSPPKNIFWLPPKRFLVTIRL